MNRSRKQRRYTITSVLAATAAFAVDAPAASGATTVTYNAGGTSPGLNITDDPGTAADLVISSGGSSNHVGARSINARAPLTAGSGCNQFSATEVNCFVTGPRIATVNLGDGNDRFRSDFGVFSGLFVRGGPGNDVIDGSEKADSLDGEAGDDILQGVSGDDVLNGGPGNDLFPTDQLDNGNDVKNGGDGDDRLIADRDPGNDVYSGGAGTDVLDFSTSIAAVSVSLDGVANDGPAGEADNAGATSEHHGRRGPRHARSGTAGGSHRGPRRQRHAPRRKPAQDRDDADRPRQ